MISMILVSLLYSINSSTVWKFPAVLLSTSINTLLLGFLFVSSTLITQR